MAPDRHRSPSGITLYFTAVLLLAATGPLQFGWHMAELNAPEEAITCRKQAVSPSVLPRALPPWTLGVAKPVQDAPGPAAPANEQPDCIPMSQAQFATISAALTIGGFGGAVMAGPIGSRHGRLAAIRVAALFFAAGSAVETGASSILLFIIGRVLSGVGAGAASNVVPLYISEIAPPASRGFFGASTQVAICVGLLLVQVLGYFWSHGSMWRAIMAAGLVVAVIELLGSFLMPESPAWQAAKGDAEGAKHTLRRLRGRDSDLDAEVASWGAGGGDEAAAAAEEQGLLAQASPTRAKPARHMGFLEVARDPVCRPAVVAVVGVSFAQQFTGINSIIMYSVSLLEDLLPVDSALLTVLVFIVNLAMTIASAPLPDRLGRKTCLLASIGGMGSSALALALSVLFGVEMLSAIAVVLFVASFAIGLGPLPFILASELVDQNAVGATQSWCLAANYFSTFLVAQSFPIVNAALNERFGGAGWVYFLFAAFATFFAVFVWYRVPETRGKKDADDVWGRTRRLD